MIAIDIPIPKTCCDCPFFDGAEYLCAVKPILKYVGDWVGEHRHPDCPLLKVEHIHDKIELSLYDVYGINEGLLSISVKDIQAKRICEFIFDHPELIRKVYSDDLDLYVRNFTVDCFVVRINEKKEDI